MNAGETHAQVLAREIQEECGMSVAHIGAEIGAVVEYHVATESDSDVFIMTSHYYLCRVEDNFGIQKLDDHEQDLGFQPIWIVIENAIQGNKALLHSDKTHEWLRREIFVLEYLQQNLLLAPGT